MALKNFHRIVAETPPEVTEKVKRWMEEQDQLHDGKCSPCVVYDRVEPRPRCVSVEVDFCRPMPRPKAAWTQEMIDDLNQFWKDYETLDDRAKNELGLIQ